MFKLIFELLINPLGLPIEWYYEYGIMCVIGFLAYKLAFNNVGGMYRSGLLSGRTSGSFFHWLIRLIYFFVLWVVTYGFIYIGKILYAHRKLVLICTINVILVVLLIIFLIKKSHKQDK